MFPVLNKNDFHIVTYFQVFLSKTNDFHTYLPDSKMGVRAGINTPDQSEYRHYSNKIVTQHTPDF